MTTEDLMKLADKFAFFMPGSEEGEKARQALLDALQSQAEQLKELSLQVVSAFGQAQEALEERDTIRAKLAALQVNAELVKALKKLLEQYDELAEEDNSGWILAGELAKANHAREVLSRAQAAPAVGVPDGYVLVPKELTEPFHPSASHINPDYRDGWNAALAAARSQP